MRLFFRFLVEFLNETSVYFAEATESWARPEWLKRRRENSRRARSAANKESNPLLSLFPNLAKIAAKPYDRLLNQEHAKFQSTTIRGLLMNLDNV